MSASRLLLMTSMTRPSPSFFPPYLHELVALLVGEVPLEVLRQALLLPLHSRGGR